MVGVLGNYAQPLHGCDSFQMCIRLSLRCTPRMHAALNSQSAELCADGYPNSRTLALDSEFWVQGCMHPLGNCHRAAFPPLSTLLTLRCRCRFNGASGSAHLGRGSDPSGGCAWTDKKQSSCSSQDQRRGPHMQSIHPGTGENHACAARIGLVGLRIADNPSLDYSGE